MTQKYIFCFLLLVIAGLLQNTGILNFYEIKPNLILVFLITLVFFISDLPIYLGFTFLGMTLLSFRGGLEADRIIIGLLSLFTFATERFLNLQLTNNHLVMVGFSTIAFYLLTAPGLILAAWPVVIGEIVYNLFIGVLMFRLLKQLYGQGLKF